MVRCEAAPENGFEGAMLRARFAQEDDIIFSDAFSGNSS
jgi:hypothetical protein